DPDTVGTVAFSLTGDDAALFSINSSTGEVRFLASPDHEEIGRASCRERVDITVDADEGDHDTTQNVAITVTDLNDVAPTITSSATSPHAKTARNSSADVYATAPDPDTVGTVAFSLTGDDAALFSINSSTGEVRFLASPDHE